MEPPAIPARFTLVDTRGLPIADRIEAADVSERRAGALPRGGLKAIPGVHDSIADEGHERKKSHKLWRLSRVGDIAAKMLGNEQNAVLAEEELLP